MPSEGSSPRSVACCGKCFALGESADVVVLERSGTQWVRLENGSRCAKAMRSWEGLDEEGGEQGSWGNGPGSSGCQLGKTATVWTAPCCLQKQSQAVFKIVNMRGRSIFQIGVTRLGAAQRSTFWGDVAQGLSWYLFLDKYGFAEIRDGASGMRSLDPEPGEVSIPNGEAEQLIQGSTIQIQFDPASGRLSFFRNGGWVGAVQVPKEDLSSAADTELVFAAQMLGRGDALELVSCEGVSTSTHCLCGSATEKGDKVAGEEQSVTGRDAGAEGVVECGEGHRCTWSRYSLDGYERGWMCSACGVVEAGARFFCPECQFDLCQACKPHHLREQAERKATTAKEERKTAPDTAVIPSDFPFHLLTPKKALFHIEGHGAYCPACTYASNSAFPAPHLDDIPLPHKFTGPQVQYYYSGLGETGFV